MKLLKAKLTKPSIYTTIIDRKKILEQLTDFHQYKMLLVSAPAGSGKSTVMTTWLERAGVEYSWYSLDDSDNDFKQYLTYLIACIETHEVYKSFQLSELLFSIQSIGINGFIHSVINVFYESEQPFVIVLDDYHRIHNAEIHQMMKMFIEHLPPHIHLVMITREDPPLSLSKLRVSRALLEIRNKDLKFDEKETTNFITYTMGAKLESKDIHTLNQKTEGWIAGIQLAVLSLHNQDNPKQMFEEISGNHYIVEYLMEEVLSHMDKDLLDFILTTSILSQFSAELCDYLLDVEPGTSKEWISVLSQSNIFIIPLDQQRKWFRYHHLFNDFLYSRLTSTSIDRMKLHYRASVWFSKEDNIDLAIFHAFEAKALDFAADLVENMWAESDRSLDASRWLEKFYQLPPDIVEKSPVLLVGYSWALLDTGAHEEVEGWLRKAENLYRGIETGEITNYRISDKEQYDMLPSTIASAYCYIAIGQGRFDEMFIYAKKAFQKNNELSSHRSGVLHMLMGLAHWTIGDLTKGREEIDKAIIDIKKNESSIILGTFEIVNIELLIDGGYFKQAKLMLDRAISSELKDTRIPLSLANLYLDYSRLYLAQGDIEEAINSHKISKTYGMKYCLSDFWYKWYQQQATLQICQGLYDSALLSLDEAEATYSLNPLPTRTTLKGLRGFIYILLEQFDNADSCFDSPYAEQDLIYQSIYFAKMGKKEEAENILNELYATAVSQNRERTATEVLLGKSVIAEQSGHNDCCVQFLQKSVPFINKKCYLESLIIYRDFLGDAYPSLNLTDKVKAQLSIESKDDTYAIFQTNQELPEPLTPRELEVLQLLANGYSNQDVCNELFLALSTVKGYNQNLFGKLGARRRNEAVSKARIIGLIK